MLKQLFPTRYQAYQSAPLLGETLDKFSEFLLQLGYAKNSACSYIHKVMTINRQLLKLECRNIKEITRSKLQTCIISLSLNKKGENKNCIRRAVKLLERYLDNCGILSVPESPPKTEFEKKIDNYCAYLKQVRGLAYRTIEYYCKVALQFLTHFNKNDDLTQLKNLTSKEIEHFICEVSEGLRRRTTFNIIAAIRIFLRYLATNGEISANLDRQIDTPRIYREEQLPRALDWDTVSALLQSINRSTAIGKRDYALLFLIATYGLRSNEVVNLKLEDIEWKQCRLRILQHKTDTELLLPLTDAVGNCIVEYLREGRPATSYREIFVQHNTLCRPLKPASVANVFGSWVRRSNLSIPFTGAHCLRHSLAVHLLRQGTSLKAIGGLLGHKGFKSTCVYLRLNIEDLRTVPLNIPTSV